LALLDNNARSARGWSERLLGSGGKLFVVRSKELKNLVDMLGVQPFPPLSSLPLLLLLLPFLSSLSSLSSCNLLGLPIHKKNTPICHRPISPFLSYAEDTWVSTSLLGRGKGYHGFRSKCSKTRE